MLLADLRYAVRTLRKSPMFTAAAVATLALGIGVNTCMFSVVNAELLRPLPFANAGRLVRVAERNDKLHLPDFTTSVLNYLSWREKQTSFEQIGAVGYSNYALTGLGDPEELAGSTITPSLLALLGMRPLIGREFRDDEDKPESARVAMLGEALWRRQFNADPAVAGRAISLNGQAYTVVGVTPAALSVVATGDILTPLLLDPPKENRLSHQITAMARLKPGIAIGQAQAEMETVAAQVGQEHPEIKDWSVRLFAFSNWLVPPALRTSLLVLMGAVVLVLGIACANVASLLLSRSVSRQQEVAVRVALGASRADLLRQFLIESLALAICGGVAGVALAEGGLRLLIGLLPEDLLPIPGIKIDGPVLLFATAMTLLTAIAFGLAPAWYSLRSDLNAVLKQGGRSSTAGQSLVRRMLVGGELALATVLLIGAGLLLESLLRLQQVRVGFEQSHILTFQLSPPPAKYPNQMQSWTLYSRLIAALEAQPGVVSAAVSSGVPFGAGTYSRTPMAPVGPSMLAPGQSVPIDWRTVSPDYLRTMKIPLLGGRFFTDDDDAGAPAVTVVSQQTAKMLWGSENPLGKVLRVVGNGKELTVIGVVGDVLNTSLSDALIPAMYYSSAQRLWPTMDVAVRTQRDPEYAISAARRVLRDLDPELPLAKVKTMEQWISTNAAQPRLNAALVGLFGASALIMGVIGIYGVLSFSVSQRTREIGLRMALGARQNNVVQLILREGMLVAATGIAIGVGGAAALSRMLTSILFQVGVHDPAVFFASALVLGAAAAVGGYIPARRASRVDPAEALRE